MSECYKDDIQMCYHVRASCGERTLMCCRETNFTKIMVVQKQNITRQYLWYLPRISSYKGDKCFSHWY